MRLAVAVALLLISAAASAQEPPPPGPTPAAPPEQPPALTDKLFDRVAAVAWCPVRTSEREEPPAAVEGEEAPVEEPGCGAGAALRLSPDRWGRWAAGLFVGPRELGPWVGYIALRTESGAVGFGVGGRIPFDSQAIDLTDVDLVFGATLSLAGLGGAR